jgi:hypothetical protein
LTLLSRNLVNTDMGNATEVTVLHAILDHALDRCGNRAPGAAKQLGDRMPGQQFGPFGQKTTIGTSQPLLACHPGKLLRADAPTSGAVHPTRLIVEPHRNIPQRYMAEKASITHVTVDGWVTTRSTAYSIPGIRANFGDQAVRVFSDRMYSKTLQINRLFDYLFYKHEFLSG